MWQELLTKLSPIWAILLPITTGIGIGLTGRSQLNQSCAKQLAKLCETLALKFFLPFFVIESVLKSAPTFDFGLAFIVGFLLPPLALVGMWLYKKTLSNQEFFTPHYNDLRFLVSTYGGGNRGIVLFILLFANSHQFDDYLKWYILVDLGNFACLLTIIYTLLIKQYGTANRDKYSFLSRFLDNYGVVTAFIVILYFLMRHFWPSIEYVLTETVTYRKFIFGALVFFAITLRFEYGTLKSFFADLVAFLFARAFTAVCTISFLLLTPFASDAVPICYSVIILVFMPPSSFLPSMIGQSNASKQTLAYVNGFTGAVNMLYLVLIAIGIVVAISQALL